MKKLTAIGLGIASFLVLAAPVSAAISLCPQDGSGGSAFSKICPTDTTGEGIGTVLGTVINLIFIIAIILAFGFLIYGGIRWITSGGDKGGVENARNTIIAAIVGLIVVFLSYIILNLVLSLFGTSLSGLTLPTLGDGAGTNLPQPGRVGPGVNTCKGLNKNKCNNTQGCTWSPPKTNGGKGKCS